MLYVFLLPRRGIHRVLLRHGLYLICTGMAWSIDSSCATHSELSSLRVFMVGSSLEGIKHPAAVVVFLVTSLISSIPTVLNSSHTAPPQNGICFFPISSIGPCSPYLLLFMLSPSTERSMSNTTKEIQRQNRFVTQSDLIWTHFTDIPNFLLSLTMASRHFRVIIHQCLRIRIEKLCTAGQALIGKP